MQFTFGDKGEVYLVDESVLPATEKERRQEWKKNIGPGMKYGHANLNSFCAHLKTEGAAYLIFHLCPFVCHTNLYLSVCFITPLFI